MKNLLAICGLGAALTLGLGSAAQAAYPPGSPGTISIQNPVCTYVDDDRSELASWSVTIDYTVTAADAYLVVINPVVSDTIMSTDAPIGSGSITVDNNTPGVGGSRPLTGNLIVELGTIDGDVVTATSSGCVVDTPVTPTSPPQLEVTPKCIFDADDPTVVDEWSIRVDVYNPTELGLLLVTDATADVFYRVDLPQGESSVVIDPTIPEFGGPLAAYQPYTIVFAGEEMGDELEARVNACPIATDGGETDNGTGRTNTTAPTNTGRTNTTAPTGNSTTANTSTGTPTRIAAVVTTTTTAPSTKRPASTPTALPKTGGAAASLALVAVSLLGGGAALVWTARRRAVTPH